MPDYFKLSRYSFYPWLVWGLGAMFFFTMYIARVSPSIIQEQLMADFQVGATVFGQMAGYLYVTYLFMQIPVGALVDRFGAHRLIMINSLVFGLSCLIFASASSVTWIIIARLMMGLTGSFAFIGAFKLALIWFPPSMLGLLAGLTQCSGMLGAAVGEGPMTGIASDFGWRSYLTGIGFVLIIIGVISIIVMRPHPDAKKTQCDSMWDLWDGFKIVIANPQSWINGLFAGLMYMPTVAFGEAWGAPFLIQTRGFSLYEAGTAVTFLFAGWVIGGVTVGMISDYIQKRKPVMIVASLMSALFFALMLYLPDLTPTIAYGVLFGFGLMNSGLIASYAMSGEINPPKVSGVSVSFCNLFSVIIGALCIPFIGIILDFYGGHQNSMGILVYPTEAYNKIFALFPLALLFAAGVSSCLKETHCHNVHLARESAE